MLNELRRYCVESVPKNLLMAAGIAAAVGAMSSSAAAAPLNPFTINPSALTVLNPINGGGSGGYGTGPISADRLDGNYSERLIVTGPGTFHTDAFMGFTGMDLNGNPVPGFGAGGTGLAQGNGYLLYALFSSDGTFTTSGSTTTFNSTVGTADLYVDPLGPLTTFNANPPTGAGFPNIAGNSDDKLLAHATLLIGQGVANAAIAHSGSFGLIFNPFTLTALGNSYFTGPVPFYMQAELNGVFDPFDVTGVTVASGSGNAFFDPVPEPASLTLLGLGLVGVARRRFAKKA
jgi:hypothetical protein